MKKMKFFMGVVLFVKAIMLLSIIIVLSIQRKSIPKAITATLAACALTSAGLLLSYRHDENRMRKLREMDAFYDEDYESAFDDDDEDYFDFEDCLKLIPDVD